MTAAGAAAHAQEAPRPPFAGDPDAEVEKPRPPVRVWTVNGGGFSFTLEFSPGIPKAGQMVEIMISVAKIPGTPHPQFGHRIPEENARFIVEFTKPSGEPAARYRAHPIPLSRGRYGLHVTPMTDGLYDLRILGKSSDGADLRADTKLPVDVWPLPKALDGTGDDAGQTRRTRRPVIVPQ